MKWIIETYHYYLIHSFKTSIWKNYWNLPLLFNSFKTSIWKNYWNLFNISIKNNYWNELLKLTIVIQFIHSTYLFKRTIETYHYYSIHSKHLFERTIETYSFKILFNISIKNNYWNELLKLTIVIQFIHSTYLFKRTIETYHYYSIHSFKTSI